MSKICFIVGHGKSKAGGYDSGAVSGSYHEFKIAKEIAKYAQQYYNKNYNETADLMNYKGDLYLQERINKLKDDTYDFIAEIHLNAGGGTGVECYYYHGSTKGQKYADKICDYIAEELGVNQRPNGTDKDGGDKVKLTAKGKDYFGIIRDTKPTAVLVETVFIDTKADLNKVKTAAGQEKCGVAIAKAVAEVRGVEKKTTTKKETTAKKETTTAKKETTTTKKETTTTTATTSKYFKRYTGNSNSLVDSLKSIGATSSFTYRKKIAKANGIKTYLGTAAQNTKLLNLLRKGKLIKP